jgi:hypothetical protein
VVICAARICADDKVPARLSRYLNRRLGALSVIRACEIYVEPRHTPGAFFLSVHGVAKQCRRMTAGESPSPCALNFCESALNILQLRCS